ncbi:MAG: T9SS type A sorting domain-containing protein [Flavobacteriales bacterium]|nr:T9SS type A sorting domain-containing protein [Flavobacteriales bacterium]
MKKILLFTIALISTQVSFAQFGELENGDMELWTNETLFENPDLWESGNYNAGFVGTTKSMDAQSGDYSVLMETSVDGEDTSMAYVIQGDVDSQEGFAYTDLVDTLKGWYKYDFQPGDSGNMFMFMYKSGVMVEQLTKKMGGTQNTWAEFSCPFNALGVIPDSFLIAFASSDFLADTAVDGSWLMVDNLTFASSYISSPAEIPNGDFENWVAVETESPDDWWTYNYLLAGQGGLSVVKTTDSKAGMYAAEITTLGWGENDTVPGIMTNGTLDNGGVAGGVPYTHQPTNFNLSCKYFPSGIDTAFIAVQFYKDGAIIGYGGQYFLADGAYTDFNMMLSVPVEPDTMLLTIWAGENPGSQFIVDEMTLTGGLVGIQNVFGGSSKVVAYPNPTSGQTNVSFNLTDASDVSVTLINVEGKQVGGESFGHLSAGDYTKTIQLDGLPSGVYLLQLKGDRETIVKKISVQ